MKSSKGAKISFGVLVSILKGGKGGEPLKGN